MAHAVRSYFYAIIDWVNKLWFINSKKVREKVQMLKDALFQKKTKKKRVFAVDDSTKI